MARLSAKKQTVWQVFAKIPQTMILTYFLLFYIDIQINKNKIDYNIKNNLPNEEDFQ